MTLKFKALAAVALAASLIGGLSVGRAAQPFDAKAFQTAQTSGRTILVDVTAPWCPSCRQQRPIVQQIEKERPELVVYEVDFDSAKDALRRFRVQHQSTLILFKGQKEVARSTGETDSGQIRALISKGF